MWAKSSIDHQAGLGWQGRFPEVKLNLVCQDEWDEPGKELEDTEV